MSVLRERRKQRRLTLKAVADAVGTDPGNLSRIERGTQFPGRELARDLATFFDLPVERVLYPDQAAQASTTSAA